MNKEKFIKVYDNIFIKLDKAQRTTKYIKRIPHPSGKGFKYFYTQEQLNDYKESGFKPGKEKKEGGILSNIMSFFGLKDSKQAKEKVKETYNANKKELAGVDESTFGDYMNEYLANKDKWDKKLSKKEITTVDKKTKKIEKKKTGDKKAVMSSKGKSWNMSLMKKVAGIVGGSKSDEQTKGRMEGKPVDRREFKAYLDIEKQLDKIKSKMTQNEDFPEEYEKLSENFDVLEKKLQDQVNAASKSYGITPDEFVSQINKYDEKKKGIAPESQGDKKEIMSDQGEKDEITGKGDGYEVKKARYAKDKFALHIPSDSGTKNQAQRLAEAKGVNGKWSNREKAYIVSKNQVNKFKKYVKEGWDASSVTGELDPPKDPKQPEKPKEKAKPETKGDQAKYDSLNKEIKNDKDSLFDDFDTEVQKDGSFLYGETNKFSKEDFLNNLNTVSKVFKKHGEDLDGASYAGVGNILDQLKIFPKGFSDDKSFVQEILADYRGEESKINDMIKKVKNISQKEKDLSNIKEKLLGPKMFKATQILIQELKKAKEMPVGTISNGRKKMPDGKWVPVSEGKTGKKPDGKPKPKGSKPTEKPKPDGKKPEKTPEKTPEEVGKQAETKERIKNALKKMANILTEALSGKDVVQPTGQAVEDTGERLKSDKKKKAVKKKPETPKKDNK